jgi:hypothetical protein
LLNQALLLCDAVVTMRQRAVDAVVMRLSRGKT